MNRRCALQSILCAGALPAAAQVAQKRDLPPDVWAPGAIQLHVDLEVDPAKERELADSFLKTFRPAIRKQPGFVDVKLLKLNRVVSGTDAEALAATKREKFTYRLLISFQTEGQRRQWVATADHQHAWPAIEKTLTGTKYRAVLYDAH